MDRSSVLDKDGNLKFSSCPFSGKTLNPDVYPVDKLKNQIEYFCMKRDSNIIQIARKLIAEEQYDSFHDVLNAVEVYQKDLGENYLPLTRELIAVWTGVRTEPITMMLVEKLNVKAINKWVTAVESSCPQEGIYRILVSAQVFNDLGDASRKSFLALSLYDDMGKLIERCKLFEGGQNLNCIFGRKDTVVMNSRPGYTYRLEYMVGSSKRDVRVEGLICKIFPTSYSLSSYAMRDEDGRKGLYIGSMNEDAFAHGQGSLEYDNGTRFVGKFEHGSMTDGVFYHGSHIRRTMTNGQWTSVIDEAQVKQYPSNMIVYDSAGESDHMKFGKSRNDMDHIQRERPESPYERRDDRSLGYNHEDLNTSRQSRFNMLSSSRESQSHSRGKGKSLADDSSSASRQLGTFHDTGGGAYYQSSMSRGFNIDDHNSIDESKNMTRKRSGNLDEKYSFPLDNDDVRAASREAEFLNNLDFADDFAPPPAVPTHRPGSRELPSQIGSASFHSSPRSTFFGGKSRSFDPLSNEGDNLMRNLFVDRANSGESLIDTPKEVRPYILHVPMLQRKLNKGGAWIGVTQSGFLEDDVKCLMISVEEYLDKNMKSNLGIALYNETGQFVVRCNIFGNRTKSKGHYRMITDEEKIVSKAKKGYFYQLQTAVNTGSIDRLQVKGWVCKIFSASKTLPSTIMEDKDGDKGVYYGPLSTRGEAHGKGYLEYENGGTFVGQFSQGDLMHGSFYMVDQIKGTMENREWTEDINHRMSHLYPQSVQFFMRDVQSKDIVYVNSANDDEQFGLNCAM